MSSGSLETFPISEISFDTKSASRTSSRTRTSTASLEAFSITEVPFPSSASSGTRSRSTTRRPKTFGISEVPLPSITSESSSEATQRSSEITQSSSTLPPSSETPIPSESSLSGSASAPTAGVNSGLIVGVVLASLVVGTLVMIFLIWRLCLLKKANQRKRVSGQWFDERKYAVSDDGGTTLHGSEGGHHAYRAALGR